MMTRLILSLLFYLSWKIGIAIHLTSTRLPSPSTTTSSSSPSTLLLASCHPFHDQQTLFQAWKDLPRTCTVQSCDSDLDWLHMTVIQSNPLDQQQQQQHNSYYTSCGSVAKPDIQQLLQFASPSRMGKDSASIMDTSFRNGVELDAKVLKLSQTDSQSDDTNAVCRRLEHYINTVIRSELYPFAERVSIVFCKLIIYPEGGFFREHRDRQRSASHQGTLLIEVKSKHEGGQLTFRAHNTKIGDWRLEEDSNKVRWCAFHPDLFHGVSPITSGLRAVLQFDLYVSGELSPSRQVDQKLKLDSINGFVSSLAPHLQQYPLAIPLFHYYEGARLLPGMLRASDRQLFDAFVKQHYKVKLTNLRASAESLEICDNDDYAFVANPSAETPLYTRELVDDTWSNNRNIRYLGDPFGSASEQEDVWEEVMVIYPTNTIPIK